jgi:hypothetical protein
VLLFICMLIDVYEEQQQREKEAEV